MKLEILKALYEYSVRYHVRREDIDRLALYVYRKLDKQWRLTTIYRSFYKLRKQGFLSKPPGSSFFYLNLHRIRHYLRSNGELV